MMRFWLRIAIASTVGCGGTPATDGQPDATGDTAPDDGGESVEGATADAREDGVRADAGPATEDGGDRDAAADEGGAVIDARASDASTAEGGCECKPYWCGCGTCNPAQIACVRNPPTCSLGCSSSCSALAQVTCDCEADRCVRNGVDASAIACLSDEGCPPSECCAYVASTSYCVAAPNTCCTDGGAACP